jgi:hypothetical protein
MSFRIVREQPEQPAEPTNLAERLAAEIVSKVSEGRALSAEIFEICARYNDHNDFRLMDIPARQSGLIFENAEYHATHGAAVQYLRLDLSKVNDMLEKLQATVAACRKRDQRHQAVKDAYTARCKALATEIAARVPAELRTQAEHAQEAAQQARAEHAAVAAKLAQLASTAPSDKAAIAAWSKSVVQLRTEAEGYSLRAQQFEAEAARAEAVRYAAEVDAWWAADDKHRAGSELSAAQSQATIAEAEAALLGAQLALESAHAEAQSRATVLAEQAQLLFVARATYAPKASQKRS